MSARPWWRDPRLLVLLLGVGVVPPPAAGPPRPPVGFLLTCWVVLAPLATAVLHWLTSG